MKVTKGEDGIWLHFGPYCMIHLSKLTDNCGPLTSSGIKKWAEEQLEKEDQSESEQAYKAGYSDAMKDALAVLTAIDKANK